MALPVTSEAIKAHGGYGFTDEFPVSRFWRGARYGTLGGGTTETCATSSAAACRPGWTRLTASSGSACFNPAAAISSCRQVKVQKS
jgi:hypothetical protein